MSELRSRRLQWVLVFCIIAILVLMMLRIENLSRKLETNTWGLRTVGALFRGETPDPGIVATILAGSCADHALMIGTFFTTQYRGLPPEQKLQLLQRFKECLPSDRQLLLAVWTSDAQWALGDYEDVCDIMIALDAPSKLLGLARHSASAGDWRAVEAALDCVQRFDPERAWVSPFIVSPLYNGLGQQYELAGDVDRAMTAYDSAARWYPVVWADPYSRKAKLLWMQGAKSTAIKWLVEGVSRSTDATATLYLWRELAHYWEQQGDLEDAACAYRNAEQLVDLVPAQNITASDRQELEMQIGKFSEVRPEQCFVQYPELRQPGVSHD